MNDSRFLFSIIYQTVHYTMHVIISERGRATTTTTTFWYEWAALAAVYIFFVITLLNDTSIVIHNIWINAQMGRAGNFSLDSVCLKGTTSHHIMKKMYNKMLKSCIGDEKNRHVHKFSHFIRVSKWRGTERNVWRKLWSVREKYKLEWWWRRRWLWMRRK